MKTSISVMTNSGNELVFYDDPKFSGLDICPTCDFSKKGCRVHRLYSGPIEACDLWNRTNPDDLGELVDWRASKPAAEVRIVPAKESQRPPLGPLPKVEEAVAAGHAGDALALLCAAMRLADAQVWPNGWLQIATCLKAAGEEGLARLCRRTAERLGAPPIETEDGIRRDFPEPAGGEEPDPHCPRLAGLYCELDFPTLAFDRRLRQVERAGAHHEASSWADLAGYHRQLGELGLAELALRRASLLVEEAGPQRQAFDRQRSELEEMIQYQQGPALDSERREAERALEKASHDPALFFVPPEDPRVDLLYWTRLWALDPPEQLALAVLARLRDSQRRLALPGELLPKLEYRLLAFAEEKMAQEGVYGHATIRKLPTLQVIQEGLLDHELYCCAAAVLAIRHDRHLDEHCAYPGNDRALAELEQRRTLVGRALALCPQPLAERLPSLYHSRESG